MPLPVDQQSDAAQVRVHYVVLLAGKEAQSFPRQATLFQGSQIGMAQQLVLYRLQLRSRFGHKLAGIGHRASFACHKDVLIKVYRIRLRERPRET
jgi:hypothetical protein